MATATMDRPRTKSAADAPEMGEDGYPVRYCTVGGVRTAFSTKPFPEAERPLYWNPIFPGQEMRWRADDPDEHGRRPTIQREMWLDGAFRPRNAWEEAMTREWMMRSLPGCSDPDRWKGITHPKGPNYAWRCECSWPCGNFDAFEAHQLYLKHSHQRSESLVAEE